MKEIVKRKFDLVALAVFLLMPIIMYFDYIQNGMILFSGDGASYFSFRNYFNTELYNNGFPMWNKYLEAGMPYGAFDSVGLYPVSLIFSFLPTNVFTYVYYFFHIIAGTCFFYFFLKEVGCNKYGAFIVALLYETSIHLGGLRKNHIMLIVGIVYLPIILFYIQKYLNTKKHFWLIVSAVVMGIQFLGAHTQIVVYTDIAVFVYLVIGLVYRKVNAKKSIAHILTWFFTYIGVILAQLVSTVVFLLEISSLGNSEKSFESFLSFSIHPIKFVMILLPKLFGENVYQPLGAQYSSEMDVEIYLGVLVALCIFFCIITYRNEFVVLTSVLYMVVVFVYSAMAHIPFIADLFYRMPIISGFRVPSRALYILIFFSLVLLGIFMTRISEEEQFIGFLKVGDRIAKKIILLTGISVFSTVLLMLFQGNTSLQEYMKWVKDIFATLIVVSLLIIISNNIVMWVKTKPVWNFKVIYILFGFLLLGVTHFETKEYALATQSVSADYYDKNEELEIVKEIASENYKVLDAFKGIDGAHNSLIGLNSAVDKNIMGINAYLTYNNPRLYQLLSGEEDVPLNYSGLMTGFSNMDEILYAKNDLLSILGVKYIIDSSGLLEDKPIYVDSINFDSTPIFVENEEYVLTGELAIYAKNVSLEAGKMYKIEMELFCDEKSEDIYFDVCTAHGLDGSNSEIEVVEGQNKIVLFYYTEQGQEYADALLRLVSMSKGSVSLKGLTVFEECLLEENISDNDALLEVDSLLIPSNDGNLNVTMYNINVTDNTDYLIFVDVLTRDKPELFYVDFYAGPEYDNAEQDAFISLESQSIEEYITINSGECPENGVQLRIVSKCNNDIYFEKIRMVELDEKAKGVYIPYYEDEETSIYLNANAKDILFVTSSVETLTEEEKLFNNLLEYDLLNKTYIRGDVDVQSIDGTKTLIENIEFGASELVADVFSESDTFVNFSQCYNSGWKAYIDDEETEVYLVDDVIMGIYVPAGEHKIRFEFTMPIFWISVGISISIIIFWLVYFIFMDIRGKKQTKIKTII